MPLKGNVRYRVTHRGGQPVRLAFRGPGKGQVVEAKNLKTGDTHTPKEFAAEKKAGPPKRPGGLSRLMEE
jgi:hypothetical protein